MLTKEDVLRNVEALSSLSAYDRIALLSKIAINHPDIMAAAAREYHAELARAEEIKEADRARAAAAGGVAVVVGRLHVGETEITSTFTRHSARMCTPAAPGSPSFWDVTWLPGRCLDRNQALTAMTIAEHVHNPAPDFRDRTPAWNRTGDGMRWWAMLDNWAAELGLTGTCALALASMSPEDAAATVSE